MNLKGIMQTMGVQPGQVVSNPYARAFAPQVEIVKEEDHEVSMGQNQLDTIIKMATELKAKMGENEKEIPAWIQDHIAKAESYISQAANNYHEYGTTESINENISKRDIEKLTQSKDLDKFFKANKNKLDKKYIDDIEDQIGGLKYLESDYKRGDTDWEEVLVAIEDVQDLIKKSLGIRESVNEEFKHTIYVDTPTQVVSKKIAAEIEALAKKGVRSKEIGLKMGFIGNQKAATDAFQKVKNQIYFKLDKANESINEFQTGFSDKKVDAKIIADKMRKYPETKNFADKIEKLKSISAQDLDKILPDFVSGAVITKLFKESVHETKLTSIVRSIVETPAIGKMVGSKLSEAKKYDVGAGYMGNGLTIWNTAEEEHGDYRIIAHIDPYGKISIRDKEIPSDVMKMIKDWAEAMKKGNK